MEIGTKQLNWPFGKFAGNNDALKFLKWRWDFPVLAVHDKNNLAALVMRYTTS